MTLKIAVVGDVHLAFGPKDVAYLDQCGADLVFFVGDLAGYSHRGALRVARYIAQLKTPTIVVPGNHDATTGPQLVAEVFGHDASIALTSSGQEDRVAELRRSLNPAILGGYSLHPLERRGTSIDLIACRPHSFGGERLGCRQYLKSAFGVETIAESANLLKRRIEEARNRTVVFLAHNGPTGLGERRDSIWGCDFRRAEGDFGDADLAAALEHARRLDKRVPAVIAGHMHHALRGGGQREWLVREGGTLFVNAARVPRVFKLGNKENRHFVEVTIDAQHADAREVLFEA